MAELDKASGFSDEELEDLFSAFGEVSAPESLKASTLGLIASLPTAAAMQEAAQAPVQVQATQATQAAAPAAQTPAASTVKASAGGKRPRPRWKAVRVAAVAACLTLAVTGGAAYAAPVSIVTLTRGDVSIELGVNLFEMSVSATSDDEAGRAIIDSTNLVHVSYQDALTRAVDALEAAPVDGELELFVESAVGMQREQLENHNELFLADRAESAQAPRDSEGSAAKPGDDRRSTVKPAADQSPDGPLQTGNAGDVQVAPDVQVPYAQVAYGSGQSSGSSGSDASEAPTPVVSTPEPELRWVRTPDGDDEEEPGDKPGDDPTLTDSDDDSVIYDFTPIQTQSASAEPLQPISQPTAADGDSDSDLTDIEQAG